MASSSRIAVAAAVAVAGVAAVVLVARTGSEPAPSATAPSPRTLVQATAQPCNGAPPVTCFPTPYFSGTLPGNASIGSQQAADCYAWQEFIALNWPVNGSVFGAPGDQSPVAWEGWQDPEMLFPPNGAPPPDFGVQPPISDQCAKEAGVSQPPPAGTRILVLVAETDSRYADVFNEAVTNGKPAWLGAQNGTNVWYEVRLGQDEYTYVTQNRLYNAENQQKLVDAGTPILLPEGQTGGAVGTFEVKAAWLEVTDPGNTAKWNRYKLAPAVVTDIATGKCRSATVALVGMHIIHKLQNQTTWVWATFEHVDNVPAATPAPADAGFNFYSADCQPRQVSVPNDCIPGGPDGGTSVVTVGCTPNTQPPYYIGPGCPPAMPIQVTRVTAIDNVACPTNVYMRNQIIGQNPDSVWQNYQLVDVLWNSAHPPDPRTPQTAPLGPTYTSGFVAGSGSHGPLANTTLETYEQQLRCDACHNSSFTTIAATPENPNPTTFSDFSFMLGHATSPPPATSKVLKAAAATPMPGRKLRLRH